MFWLKKKILTCQLSSTSPHFTTVLLSIADRSSAIFCKRSHLVDGCILTWLACITFVVFQVVFHKFYFFSKDIARTTPLKQWGFQKCLPFSLTALRGKHCRHPIAVTGVVDTFEQDVLLFMTLQGNLYFEFKCFKNWGYQFF